MHLNEEQIQRLLHGELDPRSGAAAREHVSACADCRARFEAAEREERDVHALLRAVDHPAPAVSAEAIAARARRPGWHRYRWAAGLMLALGAAGAAYAVPGSPVRGWVRAVVQRVSGPDDAAPPAREQAPGPAGIAVDPGAGLIIEFTTPAPDGRLRVSLNDVPEVVVRAPSGAARYTSEVGRLVIDNTGGPAMFDISIPRAAPQVEIRVGGRRVLLKEGPRITTDTIAATAGPYLLPLTAGVR